MDHNPVQCPRTFPNKKAGFGGCAKFPFLSTPSKGGGDPISSCVWRRESSTEFFESRCQSGGEPFRVPGYVIELRRQATQLIKYEDIPGRAVDDVLVNRKPDQAETAFVPVREQTLCRQEQAREVLDCFIGAEYHDRLSVLYPTWIQVIGDFRS